MSINDTPRLRSAFPSSPQTPFRYNANARSRPAPQTSQAAAFPSKKTQEAQDGPIISLQVLDAPTQRLYVAALYAALTAWRLRDWWSVRDELDSTWCFMKWLGIDFVFILGIPGLRIPWLEWSFSTSAALILLHMIADVVLMFQIPIPLGTWIAATVRLLYHREISISERKVKPADILHNASLILGKQIIHILPEGSAILNPENRPFCIDTSKPTADLPIRINQTSPILLELLRTDPETMDSEVLVINSRQAKSLKKLAEKTTKAEPHEPLTLLYQVKKTGIYQLQKVVDESKLEVQRIRSDVFIPPCPIAKVTTEKTEKCKGDLSDVRLEVSGIPPFSVKYSKYVNQHDASASSQTIYPPGLESPLRLRQSSNALLDPRHVDLLWARKWDTDVPINELLSDVGEWSYDVEEIQDALGNVISYNGRGRPTDQKQRFNVHERPMIAFRGCSAEKPLKVAKEDSAELPVKLDFPQTYEKFQAITFNYTLIPEGADGQAKQARSFTVQRPSQRPRIKDPGRYTLESVASDYCAGLVSEPSNCFLTNPPEPELSIKAEDVADQCAGRPIGVSVDLDMVGTPPFKVRYTISREGRTRSYTAEFDGLRGHLDLKPPEAGHYVYEFLGIIDEVYGEVPLKGSQYRLTQHVKPPASAAFKNVRGRRACLDDSVSIDLRFVGDAPWDVEYDIVHKKQRKPFNAHAESGELTITTPPLTEGGDYIVILRSVQDNSGCRTSLNQELEITVRPERPKASFGFVEGKRSLSALEGQTVNLPLRLQGLPPWELEFIREDDSPQRAWKETFYDSNAKVAVKKIGTYQLTNVHDSCPGTVDPDGNRFTVSWVDRPSMDLVGPGLVANAAGKFQKESICQGDEDSVVLELKGQAPFHVQYQQQQRPAKGTGAVALKDLTVATSKSTVMMDSSKAGDYTYRFQKLTDSRYAINDKHKPITLQQKVHALPTARFEKSGETFTYCKEDTSGNDLVPIVLEGEPPFSVEVGIIHHGHSKPEVIRLKDINSRYWKWSLPHRGLEFGTHSVNIRKVIDARGCERSLDHDPSSIRIRVSDAPTIIPLENQQDYCVGERISYSLSGQSPFEIFYNFQGRERKAIEYSNTFRRIAEQPGKFTISRMSDSASGKCKAEKDITKFIHPMPTVRIGKGRTSVVDIHQGGEADLFFEFTGTPPFEFT
ncbi:MAG: hypothetical protein Q9227_001928 [Pyrenula ochraceoflavens]